jgi:hypothetical protein
MLVANPTKAREVGGELNGSHHSTATNGINSKTTTEMSLHSNGVQRNSNSSSLMSSRIASTSQQQSKMSSELKQTSLFEQTKSSKLGNYLLLTSQIYRSCTYPLRALNYSRTNVSLS